MKIKSLLIGMLACTALVGCSDDVIAPDNLNGEGEKVPAYLSVSFSTGGSSSRSTADDANNQGDTHNKGNEAGQEHSGHINAGTSEENAINSVLLVVKHTGEAAGFAKLYDAPASGFPNSTVTDHTTHIELTKEIKLSTSEYPYDVLVVANPYESLYSTHKESGLLDGTDDAFVVNALYDAILNGQSDEVASAVPGGFGNNFARGIVQTEVTDGTTSLKGIMMANQKMCSVTLKNAGETEIADVVIERVASKITFRETNDNIYEVKVPDLTSVKIECEIVEGVTYNKATLGGKTYYIVKMVSETATTYTYYTKSGDTFVEVEGKKDLTSLDEGTEWVYKAGDYKTENWYVKLEKYALVNLSKHTYNVRHTIADNAPAVPFGKLTGNNYLYTPNWETENNGGINNVSFDEYGNFASSGFTTSPWFYNTLANVSTDSKGTGSTYFTDLGAWGMDGTDETPDVDADNMNHKEDDSNDPTGYLLAYCLENTTDIDNQTHGLSTGISFQAKIYKDETCETPIEKLYRYNGYLFESIEAIETAYDIDLAITDNSTAEELAAAGVAKFDGNTCYYYTTEIKHFDNGKPNELGNMEFAIMRNNIYSLAVTDINVIGDPWVDPIPSTPDEVNSSAIDVHVQIVPWIVRYHDIEFK